MKKIWLILLLISSNYLAQAQDNSATAMPKNEYSVNILPLFQRAYDNSRQFGLYRRYYGKNALRISFAGDTYATNPDA